MTTPTRGEFTDLLGQSALDKRAHFDALFRMVYEELLQLARRQMIGPWGKQTLDTTGLVHEAYLKLVDASRVTQKGRSYFFGAAARAMRQILVDAARRRNRIKRGGEGNVNTSLDETTISVDEFAAEIVSLSDGLESLARIMPRQAQVVELRFFWRLDHRRRCRCT